MTVNEMNREDRRRRGECVSQILMRFAGGWRTPQRLLRVRRLTPVTHRLKSFEQQALFALRR